MLAVAFAGSRPIHKPADMTDEQCGSLEIIQGEDVEGIPYFMSCWQPSKEDKEAIASGRPIWLKVCGRGHPPVAIFTTDEMQKVNQ